MRIALVLFILAATAAAAFGETECGGSEALVAPACAGDGLSDDERELIRLVNSYRSRNGLPAVSPNPSLNLVANRHLLDLSLNIGRLTHSWSNCDYDIGKQSTWHCIIAAPIRLRTGYSGNAFENLYRNLGGPATPALALAGWQKSPPHNALLLNLEPWNDSPFNALGVAIRGNWSAVWMGTAGGGSVDLNREIRGLGVSYAKLVRGLSDKIAIERESSVAGADKWLGRTADGSVRLEIFGRESDVSESSIGLTARLGAGDTVTADTRTLMLTFTSNLRPDWLGREKWLAAALTAVRRNPRLPVRATVGNMIFEMRVGPGRTIQLSVRPNVKARAIEL